MCNTGIRADDRADWIKKGFRLLGHLSNVSPETMRMNGLQPGQKTGFRSPYGPRPGHVYLYREDVPVSAQGCKYVYLVDWEQLDLASFAVDEDWYFSSHSSEKRNPPMRPPLQTARRPESVKERLLDNVTADPPGQTAGEWIENFAAALDTPDQVLRSLEYGSVAYRGGIAPEQISYYERKAPHQDPRHFPLHPTPLVR